MKRKEALIFFICILFIGSCIVHFVNKLDKSKEPVVTSIDIKVERYKRIIKAQDKSLDSLTVEYLKSKKRYDLFLDSILNR